MDPWDLVTITALFRAVYLLVEPVKDIDSYWHVVLGREIIERRSIDDLGSRWSWYDPVDPWFTSQWGSEVLMSAMVDTFGWSALVVAKVVFGLAIAASIAVVIRARCSPRLTALIVVLVLAVVTDNVQDRPNVVSLLALVWVGASAQGVLRGGTLPTWWWLPAMTLWANLHGGWVFGAAVLGLATMLAGLNQGWRASGWSRAFVRIAAIGLAGLVNPLTWRSLTLPFEFSERTAHVIEWQQTTLADVSGVAAVLLFLLLTLAWARSPGPVPGSEVAYATALVIFALLAERNLPLAVLALAPVVAFRTDLALGWHGPDRSPRERRLVAVALAAVCTIALSALPSRVLQVDPLAAAAPVDIAKHLHGTDRPLVLNEYNASGVLIAFGPDDILLTIDGRADRFPPEYVERHQAFQRMSPGWDDYLAEVDPDFVVAYEHAPVVEGLTRVLGWSVVLEDDPYVLLTPGAADGHPSSR